MRRRIALILTAIMLLSGINISVYAETPYLVSLEDITVASGVTTSYTPISDSQNHSKYYFETQKGGKFNLIDEKMVGDKKEFLIFSAKSFGIYSQPFLANETYKKYNDAVKEYLGSIELGNTVTDKEGKEYQLDLGIAQYIIHDSTRIMNYIEFNKYRDKFSFSMKDITTDSYMGKWMINNVTNYNGVIKNIVVLGYTSYFGTTSNGRPDQANSFSHIRPYMWISEDYFKNEKINMTTAGENIISMLADNFTRDELVNAGYDPAELNYVYPSVAEELKDVSIDGEYTPGETVSAIVNTKSGIEGIYGYCWETSNTVDFEESIAVGNDNTYTIQKEDAEKFLRVTVSSKGIGENEMTSYPVKVGPTLTAIGTSGTYVPETQTLNNPIDYLFTPEGCTESFSLLDSDKKGRFFVLAADCYGSTYFGSKIMNNNDSTQLGYYLNNVIYDGLAGETFPVLDENIKAHLVEYSYPTDNANGDYYWNAKLAVLSYSEYMRYAEKFGFYTGTNPSGAWWWLRSLNNGKDSPLAINCSVSTSKAKFYTDTNPLSVRPCFWIDRDYFLNNRIDINSAGEDVLNKLRTEYLRSEFEDVNIYSKRELDKIYDIDRSVFATDVRILGVSSVGRTLHGVYNYNGTVAEGESLCRWYIKQGEEYIQIQGANSSSYVIQESDLGKEICFEIEPVNINGGFGKASKSNVTKAVTEEVDFIASLKNIKEDTNGVQSKFTVEFNFKNKNNETKTAVLVIAVYTGANQIVDMVTLPVNVESGESVASVSLNNIVLKDGYKVRAMALNDLDNLNLLCVAELN